MNAEIERGGGEVFYPQQRSRYKSWRLAIGTGKYISQNQKHPKNVSSQVNDSTRVASHSLF